MTPGDLILTPRGVRFMGRYFPCSIGKGGISANKREGDGATPTGIHKIVGGFYRPDRIAPPRTALPMMPLRLNDLWSDDVKDAEYNHLVNGHNYSFSHEKLRRADPLYDLVLVTSWNWPCATPGKGSAIFIHEWRRPGYGTEGCVAFSRTDLHYIVENLRPGARLIVPDQP
ncbi:L,D-transpeptidase family protein [Halocynthiibacter styelae]|uniref:L,D-transpeptidase family protein n=1 Tax=Halocynthiibacter styelae TaxID=2761955 RepID=A0A8J7LQT7_9RHOB|nr:L,D-transpeptidase family protein [Paenihalocynthiibacter styelae]MBI1494747.1 L,D-transpeptidase family protein [Paenihalocynthiibacter styelae]